MDFGILTFVHNSAPRRGDPRANQENPLSASCLETTNAQWDTTAQISASDSPAPPANEQLMDRLAQIQQTLIDGLARVDQRFDGIEGTLTGIEGTLTRIEGRVTHIEDTLTRELPVPRDGLRRVECMTAKTWNGRCNKKGVPRYARVPRDDHVAYNEIPDIQDFNRLRDADNVQVNQWLRFYGRSRHGTLAKKKFRLGRYIGLDRLQCNILLTG
ncbi:hypothetical protein DACRYDRAFT_116012 [Dacryopinax primogenitus]|uniref:Uncharacterized protein n=1 Tax=Dacryopinax primogenitus (strain DJM 731) TaxID=1858805 RepID=M5G8U5_DACPD|nr:uncharacterized protein DACRYDRAFT_116012 [Dacryopinax primogenitus]EJU02282.1 hypothetical protein DACRYDRAFT_116012 [Dacryopinax primogenitus]